ncbi:ShlB/FhaC/HecB family hemolysin secretion/activation protein [Massilia glaciei]|uniref:ShlB/FhaC/HecB family hemolysin secretion/activation protein n=1 Tax=Massilia glaciei TaxID=1524097 RepID=A0A2U2HLK2_9BURK|nr:ShlB/FhaC/HecB family hemolysin secretion/activation protein [Massilia glaciei]PWF48373.1 ShlB/FhaC/HecB family hemolysin secretion/activation protein [Massilia glaciei]
MKTTKKTPDAGNNIDRPRSAGASGRTLRRLAGAIALMHGAAAFAQVVAPNQVDAAALQRQETERRRIQEQAVRAVEAPVPVIRNEQPAPSAVPMTPGVQFTLREIRFGPSTYLSGADLAGLAARHVGKKIDFNDLSNLVAEVNALYRQRGVTTARAILRPQKIEGGVVQIELVEARLGRVEVAGNAYTRPGWVAGWLSGQQGQTLDLERIEDRLQRFNRGGEVQMEASLRPGASFGLSDILLTVREPARFQVRGFLNNEGSESIGREQLGVDATFNGPAGIGDRLALNVTRSRGATMGYVSYKVPFNRRGGNVSATYSDSATNVLAGPYAALGITGRSKSFQLAAVEPVWHRGGVWIDLAASVGRTASENLIDGLMLSDSVIRNQTIGATVSALSSQRSMNLTLTATRATATAVNTEKRSFTVRQLAGTLVENFGDKHFASLRATLQNTNQVILPPSLLFQLGGVASVRGYEVGAVSGDNGYLFNLEFHRTLSDDFSAFVFSDVGGVRIRDVPNQRVQSIGAGLDLQSGKAMRANITLGYALKEVLPDQSKLRLTGRVSYEF